MGVLSEQNECQGRGRRHQDGDERPPDPLAFQHGLFDPSVTGIRATAAEFDSHGKWWAVATKSRLYTGERLTDADNGIRMLPEDQRIAVRRTLDAMATQPDDADGLAAAAQLARTGQEAVDNTANPAPKRALTTAAFVVLHGMVAQACASHPDTPSLKKLIAAIHEMPLPHLEKGNGNPERLLLEQEMSMSVDDKTMKALLASAPGMKKSPP